MDAATPLMTTCDVSPAESAVAVRVLPLVMSFRLKLLSKTSVFS